jgi:enoyl-CoA hydratase
VSEVVHLEEAGAVATLVLDDPPVNAMGNELLRRLGEHLRALATREDIRVVVITGAGEKSFAAGANLREFAEMLGDAQAIEEHTALSRAAFDAVAAAPQPVVAALQASALGGGFELAMACDFVVADERARLGLPESGLGLMPGAGGTQRLPRVVGRSRALVMMLLGTVLGAPEAQALGLVHTIAPPGEARERTERLAATLADRPRLAVQAIKRAVRAGLDQPLADALATEHGEFARLLASDDARIGVDAFLARHEPGFKHS